jgi:hypothetical protein
MDKCGHLHLKVSAVAGWALIETAIETMTRLAIDPQITAGNDGPNHTLLPDSYAS